MHTESYLRLCGKKNDYRHILKSRSAEVFILDAEQLHIWESAHCRTINTGVRCVVFNSSRKNDHYFQLVLIYQSSLYAEFSVCLSRWLPFLDPMVVARRWYRSLFAELPIWSWCYVVVSGVLIGLKTDLASGCWVFVLSDASFQRWFNRHCSLKSHQL